MPKENMTFLQENGVYSFRELAQQDLGQLDEITSEKGKRDSPDHM